MPRPILISYFEPFDGASFNASSLVHEVITELGPSQFRVVQLPVSFAKAWPVLLQKIGEIPELIGVVAFGEAGERTNISLERIAVNWQQARIADNDQQQPTSTKINPQGPDGLFSSLPIDSLTQNLRLTTAVPIEVSNSAGTFVCNDLMYHLMEYSLTRDLRSGFIHVPALRPQSQVFASQQQDLKSSLELLLRELSKSINPSPS